MFHHRDYPEIIYSVLDFTAYEEQYKGRKLQRLKEKAVKEEIDRIRASLKRFAKGKKPESDFDRRIEILFNKFGKASRKAYRKASELKQIRYQRGIKERFRDGLVRSGRYLYAIEKIFKAQGLPLGLARLPLVESSFDYRAYSSVGAAGIWQFVRATGRRYMRVNSSIDERRDPILATRAAARYLSNAYNQLGSWPLAITSYNHGLAGIKRAVSQTGSRNLAVIAERYQSRTFGFASGNFYAEFVAALQVERNSELYFPGLERESPWYFDEVKLGTSIRFSDLVKSVGATKEEISRLNLGFRNPVLRNQVRIPSGSVVKVPKGKGATVVSRFSSSKKIYLSGKTALEGSRLGGSSSYSQKYRVRRGDTVGSIARKFKVRSSELMDLNRISNPRRLRLGSVIKIPGEGGGSSRPRSSTTTHKVRRGETLGGIARRYRMSVASLKSRNSIKGSTIHVGQLLKISGVPKSGVAKKSKHYKVVAGDTLGSIAERHGTSVSQLRKLNPGLRTVIFPGQRLVVR